MSARSEILGWVIRRLNEIDAADPAARAQLFDALRAEVDRTGFAGLPPAEARPHLDSAIARQEVYWLSQQLAGATPAPAPDPVPPSVPPTPRPSWGWRRFLPVPKHPPGPPAGEATGPFADHVYETVPLIVGRGQGACRLSWAYDPACVLTADCPEIGFAFRTRAASFRHAAEHLRQVLARGGLALPVAAFVPGAEWAADVPDGETVRVPSHGLQHAFARLPE
ncbi:MAG: hypothetical protein KDA53_02630 [Hyphomonas sp.]|nr:hypothetical protein [Hyphomonas sp.]